MGLQSFIDNLDGFLYERVLLESNLWITFLRIGEISFNSRVVGNSARKRKSTYFIVTMGNAV